MDSRLSPHGTHDSVAMTRLDAASSADELDRSITLIEDRLSQPCRHFAYPKALAPSPEADAEVRRRFRTASLAGNRVNVPGRTDPARLGRTPIKRTDDAGRFMDKVMVLTMAPMSILMALSETKLS